MRYRNPWFVEGKAHYGPEFYSTTAKPVDYRGFQIVSHHKGDHRLVKDGVCLTIRAGRNGPRNLADALCGDASADAEWLVDRARAIAAQFGVRLPTQVEAA